MAEAYVPDRTALLMVDPYNDFLAEGGKAWPMVRGVAEKVGLLDNLRAVLAASRRAWMRVVYVPHRRWRPGDCEGWKRPTPHQLAAAREQTCAKDTWGGQWHPDLAPRPEEIVAQEHWGSSGFASTDLDVLLKQLDVARVIVVGVMANTCIEATARFASELGYHVTLVKDATAASSDDAMHAALDVNGPTFAHAILSTREVLAAIAGR